MIVKIPKDIDATEAKIYKGLSLKKGITVMIAGGAFFLTKFTLGLPDLAVSCICGIIMFFGFFQSHGMNAFTISVRVIESFVSNQQYTAESISNTVIRSAKKMKKDAVEWNRTIRKQKRRKSEAYGIEAIRCTKGKKSRK